MPAKPGPKNAIPKKKPVGTRNCPLYLDGYGGIVSLLRCKRHPELRDLLPRGPALREPLARAIEKHTGAKVKITAKGGLEW